MSDIQEFDMLNKDVKRALIAIFDSVIHILFTLPSLFFYQVFAEPLIWLFSSFIGCIDGRTGRENPSASSSSSLINDKLEDIKPIKTLQPVEPLTPPSSPKIIKHYSETLLTNDLFFKLTIDAKEANEKSNDKKEPSCAVCL